MLGPKTAHTRRALTGAVAFVALAVALTVTTNTRPATAAAKLRSIKTSALLREQPGDRSNRGALPYQQLVAASSHKTLPPARVPSIAPECNEAFYPSRLVPLFCADGALNAAAWRWFANNKEGGPFHVLSVGRSATYENVRSAACIDARHHGVVDAIASEQLAAVYYDWSFLGSPLIGLTDCAAGTTTTPAPPTTTIPSARTGTAIATIPLSNAGTRAMNLIQSFASDLAQHQWSAARAIDPQIASDAELAVGYGALDASTVVVTGEGTSGGNLLLRGAYVAWETINEQPRTSIYCTQWTVSPSVKQILSTKSIGSDLVGYTSDWTNPVSLVSVVSSTCGT